MPKGTGERPPLFCQMVSSYFAFLKVIHERGKIIQQVGEKAQILSGGA
jgi:hypothetical protein